MSAERSRAALRNLAAHELESARRAGTNAAFAEARAVVADLLDPARSALRPLSIRILASSNVDALVVPLELELCACGRRPVITTAGFDQWRQELLDPVSTLGRQPPDVVLLLVDRESLDGRSVEHAVQDLTGPSPQALARGLERIVVANVVVPVRHGATVWRPVDDRLAAWAASEPRVRLLDLDAAAAAFGKARLRDARLWHIAGVPFATDFFPLLAREVVRVLAADLGVSRKCIVLDLDGTLWGGILGEQGPRGIELEGPAGAPFRAFQKALAERRAHGTLLALASKNEPSDVERVLADHPAMVLREADFVARRIGWSDKSESVRAIAEELGLGLDALVFWDDNPAERLRVATALPEVTVAEPPDDPAAWPGWLDEQIWFEAGPVTEEDRTRTADYHAQAARREAAAEAGSLEDFLRGLQMVATVTVDDAASLPRIAQLVAKTNQLNLTSRRHGADRIAEMIAGPDHRVYALRVDDRFGAAGLVGVAIVETPTGNGPWRIDTFLLSCRVIGRRLETALLSTIAADARAAGAAELVGEMIETPRNTPARTILADHGFARRPDGTWTRAIDPPILAPEVIDLHRPEVR